jgi:histidinol-phosphate phosphatase family protein
MLLSLPPGTTERWGLVERWCWESMHSWAMVDGPMAGVRAVPHVDPERTFVWPIAEPPVTPDPTDPAVETLERAAERVLAFHRGGVRRPAAFLDRDGTLVVERGYASSGDQMELLPGVPEAIRQLQAAGYAVVVVSNQSGVGRGLFPLAAVHDSMAALRRRLRAHGVELDAIYFCPHRPDEGCRCRKPAAGLLRDAAHNLQLSLKDSVMIGDKRIDVATGHAVGALGILVRSGYGGEEAGDPPPASGRPPDGVCADLAEAAALLTRRRGEA